MPKKLTHEEFMAKFEEKQPELFVKIEVLGEYINIDTKIKCRCKIDGYEWETRPATLLQGHGCPQCSGMAPYTTESFKEKLKKINPNIEIIGEYVNSKTKIKCRCKIDGYEWETRPATLLQGHGCPQCSGLVPYTTESFKIKLKEINPNIEILGEYINVRTKIKCRCKIDGYEWWATPHDLLCGYGCARCGGVARYTTESFKEKLKEINPNIEVFGEYINNATKIKCRCLIDGYEWEARPGNLLAGYGCPKCAKNIRMSFEEFTNKFQLLQPEKMELITILGYTYPYVKCKCLICGKEWEATIYNLLKGSGCPKCAHNQTSWLQDELFNYFSQKYPSTLFRDKTLIDKELDIVIPELNIAIEPGGWYWHFEFKNRLPNDYQKQLLCKEKGYRCITLYDACDFPDALWYPALVYDMDIGQHKELLQDVIDDIESVINELNTQKEVFKNEYESR